MHSLILSALLCAQAAPPAGQPAAIGRGTLIARDTGYYPKPPAFGGVWVSIPSVLTVVGREPSYMPVTGYNLRPLLVCVDGYENVYLLDPAKVRPADVVKLVRGPLPEVNPSRPIEYEPPKGPAAPCPCGPACDCSPCVCPPAAVTVSLPETQEPPLSYAEAWHQAVRENRRLVVWVGRDYAQEGVVPGCVNCVVFHPFAGMESGIMVGVPDGRGDLKRFDLPHGSTDAQILAVGAPQPANYKPTVNFQRFYTSPVFFGGCANGRCGR